MMEKTVQQAVANLQNEISQRNGQIQRSVQLLQKQEAFRQKEIADLMRELVNCELAGDTQSQHKVEQKISKLQSEQDIQGRIEGYETALADKSWLSPRIEEIFKIAKDQDNRRTVANQEKSIRGAEIEREFIALRDEAKKIGSEIKILQHGRNVDEKEISSLAPAIESRPIAQPIDLLKAFAEGRSYESYLVQPQKAWIPPYQQQPVVVESPRVPRQVTQREARNLMIGEHANSGFVAQQ